VIAITFLSRWSIENRILSREENQPTG